MDFIPYKKNEALQKVFIQIPIELFDKELYGNLNKENKKLHKIIDKFYITIEKFIEWICYKFNLGESKELVRNFEKETNTFIDPVKQIAKENREKEWDREM